MPKGLPKRRKKGARGDNQTDGASLATGSAAASTADEEAMSVASQGSYLSDDLMQPLAEDAEEPVSEQDNFEDKLKACVDGMTDKSVQKRVLSFKGLCAALSKKYILDSLEDIKVTVADSVERSLKRGRVEEQTSAALSLMLLMVQLGVGDDADNIFEQVRSTLVTTLIDGKQSPKSRAACASAIGMGAFIASSEDVLDELMTRLQTIYSLSFLKGDGTSPQFSPDVCHFHTAALQAWCLLLTVRPLSPTVKTLIISHLTRLPELLQSSQLPLRIAAGEAIALLYEIARADDEYFVGPSSTTLVASLKQMATDGTKYRAKKERKSQRSSFREILLTVEGDGCLDEEIKFARESLYLDTWKTKLQYEAFSSTLGSGMNTHLQTNSLLREVFDLGTVVDMNSPVTRESKYDRRLCMQAASKARCITRMKHRDKRIPRL